MSAPTFTVIVPVYNAAATIASTVASVLTQTDGDFEVLLIDDGSTDDSLARMLAICVTDERIHVLAQSNVGVAVTRNRGADLAQGAAYSPFSMQTICGILKSSRATAPRTMQMRRPAQAMPASSSCKPIMKRLIRAAPPPKVPSEELSVVHLLGENPVCTTSNLVVARDVFAASGGFHAQMAHAEDQEWLVRIAARRRAHSRDRRDAGWVSRQHWRAFGRP